MKKREHRTLQRPPQIEMRDSASGGLPTIVGYAAVFNAETNIGGFFERIKPGAFARAIAEQQDVRALFNHDPNFLLGRLGAGTLRMAEDEQGLRVEIDPPDTQTGREVVELIRRGDIYGMSFGFMAMKESWDSTEDGVALRILEDVDLFDVSPVTFPAYEQTEVAVRSAAEAVLQERHRRVNAAHRLMRMRLRLAEIA